MFAYFDCFSGISGDMTLGALIDLGVPADWLRETLRDKLPLQGFDLAQDSVISCGISARRISVRATDETERNYRAIHELISASALPPSVIGMSLNMFDRLAAAEAQIHGCAAEEVHFHEVGGVDAIVDMVGTALAVDYLGIDKVWASALPMGSGTVESRHGTLPLPAPATVALLRGVPVYDAGIDAELVTPTGAAIITTLASAFDVMPEMVIDRAGYGAGQREFAGRPNVLRIITGRGRAVGTDSVMLVETCIDDMNPEIYGYLADHLFAQGARDVVLFPVYMKKGRPGTMLQVLCDRGRCAELVDRILLETSAIGVRYYPVGRRVLQREASELETPYGKVLAKRVYTPDGGYRVTPEYDSCRQIAESQGVPLQTVYRAAQRAADSHGDANAG